MRARLRLATAAAVGTIYGVQGISAAIPGIQAHLGAGGSMPGLMTAAYMLPAVLFALPMGYLSDVVGRRRVFVVTAVLWSVAGAAQALVGSVDLLLALRFAQGVGFAALMPLSVTLIGDAVQGLAQLRAQASRQVLMTLAEFALPLLGAALAAVSWNAPLVAQGALLPMAVVGAFVLDDRRRAVRGMGPYAVELRVAMGSAGMPALLIAGFLRFWCKFGAVSYVPFLLVRVHGARPIEGALVLSVSSLVAALTATQVVRLLRAFASSRLLRGAVVVVGASMIGFALAPGWQVALAIAVIYGVGDGLLMVAQNALVSEVAPAVVRAGLVAANGMVRNAGKLLSPLAVGVLILVAPPEVAVGVIGAIALVLVPALRSLTSLDAPMALATGRPTVTSLSDRSS